MGSFGILSFRCNICGSACSHPAAALGRELASCRSCGSTVRMRAMMHALTRAMYGYGIALPDLPVNKEIVGIGMSDWIGYATPLAEKFAYQNSYYHQEPRLDITKLTDADICSVDFIVSTDVFEHVCPPVSTAFENALKMLKPGGALIFSVPYALTGTTTEHFPELHDFRIEERSGRRVLINRTALGVEQEFPDLVFHGGEGDTLEMRVFSESDLLRDLRSAGFNDIQLLSSPCFEFGIWHRIPASLPIIARRERALMSIEDFGPKVFDRKTAGQSIPQNQALWIKINASPLLMPLELWIGDIPVSVNSRPDLVTCLMPEAILSRPGMYPVVIKAKNSTHPFPVGTLYVLE